MTRLGIPLPGLHQWLNISSWRKTTDYEVKHTRPRNKRVIDYYLIIIYFNKGTKKKKDYAQ